MSEVVMMIPNTPTPTLIPNTPTPTPTLIPPLDLALVFVFVSLFVSSLTPAMPTIHLP